MLFDGNRQKYRVRFFREKCVVGERSRRHDAGDAPLHRAFGFRGIADLIADRHRDAEFHETCEVLLERRRGNPRHRNGIALVGTAFREREADQLVDADGIVKKRFVEVADAVKKHHAGVFVTQHQVLAHGGRVVAVGAVGLIFFAVGCFSHRRNFPETKMKQTR